MIDTKQLNFNPFCIIFMVFNDIKLYITLGEDEIH